ncbi:hypothetical protein DNTS_016245 [Danionella cerebrum]|uniref:SEA domain-containing protein n=1 Tax=Danionella cerebrum TaxID=2873325 RepID=A0A553Q0R1_9TELE|nr:hypothetical protein DNTS_016245 [Danionella translucida]
MKQSTVVIVFLLGLFFKVADAENSTQMYFLEFEFEKSVKSNVMGFLKLLTQIDNTNAVLSEFNSTTVSIKATSTISDEPCGILCNPSYKNTLEYQNKTQNYTKMLSEKFSTLKYFESLVITGFRSGSILADYTVQLLGPVSASALSKVAMNLNDTKLNTTGFVTITAPVNQPIDINSAAKITCTPQLNQPGLLGPLKGSIFAFVIPVGAIVFVNMFTLAVVIMKIATPAVSEAKVRDEKDVGFFILLTNYIGEKRVRDALLKRFKSKQSVQSKNEHLSKSSSSEKKK